MEYAESITHSGGSGIAEGYKAMKLPGQLLDSDFLLRSSGTKESVAKNQSYLQAPFRSSFLDDPSLDQILLKLTKEICERYKVQFVRLSTIQRKFVTHYRCNECGLLPLYNLDLLHVKRVRCKKCGQLVAFKRKGKYGKLRKDIAVELLKEIR